MTSAEPLIIECLTDQPNVTASPVVSDVVLMCLNTEINLDKIACIFSVMAMISTVFHLYITM